MKEIFVEIAVNLRKIISCREFNYAILTIEKLKGVVGYTGHYIDCSGDKKWLDLFEFGLNNSVIEDLYKRTQQDQLNHANWNKANFKLFFDNKFEIEYIWDQELQDEVDFYNQK